MNRNAAPAAKGACRRTVSGKRVCAVRSGHSEEADAPHDELNPEPGFTQTESHIHPDWEVVQYLGPPEDEQCPAAKGLAV